MFFTFIALLAGVVLIGVTYGLTRNNLLDDEESDRPHSRRSSTPTSSASNSRSTRTGSVCSSTTNSAPRPTASPSLSSAATRPNAPSPMCSIPPSDFPEQLVDSVRSGTTAIQRTTDRRIELT